MVISSPCGKLSAHKAVVHIKEPLYSGPPEKRGQRSAEIFHDKRPMEAKELVLKPQQKPQSSRSHFSGFTQIHLDLYTVNTCPDKSSQIDPDDLVVKATRHVEHNGSSAIQHLYLLQHQAALAMATGSS